MAEKLMDAYGREVNYLRLSVTEQCNLNCFYCRSSPVDCGVVSQEESLTASELVTIGQAAVELGIKRIRLTGGEPLLRPDILVIVQGLARIPGIKDLSLTTNGVMLHRLAFDLAAAGLNRVNISLDSLDEANFKQITKGGKLSNTLLGIERSIEAGLTPVKINVVLLKGVNDHEIQNFLSMTLDKELDVRFIEYMPCQQDGQWVNHFVSLEKVTEIASRISPLISVEGEHGGGPAQYFRLEHAVGKIGLISPLSRHFCDRCNRLRVTSDGKIKPCLFSEEEFDLKPFLNDKRALQESFRKALTMKPDPGRVAHTPEERGKQYKSVRSMTQTGG